MQWRWPTLDKEMAEERVSCTLCFQQYMYLTYIDLCVCMYAIAVHMHVLRT